MAKTESNQKFIIRTDRAGVFYAGIKERRGAEADLIDARRIYYWEGAATLSQLSQEGLNTRSSKVTVSVPKMTVIGVIELHECSEKATANLDGVPEWRV